MTCDLSRAVTNTIWGVRERESERVGFLGNFRQPVGVMAAVSPQFMLTIYPTAAGFHVSNWYSLNMVSLTRRSYHTEGAGERGTDLGSLDIGIREMIV